MSTIITHTGKLFNYAAPTVDMVDIHDVAHGLSHVCRFAGHTKEFYSVAQHSVLVTYILDRLLKAPRAVLKYGLLHDASEAWMGDVPTPLKTILGDVYKSLEARVQNLVHAKFDLPAELDEDGTNMVKLADLMALKYERHRFVTHHEEEWSHIINLPMLVGEPDEFKAPMPAALAKQVFLRAADALDLLR